MADADANANLANCAKVPRARNGMTEILAVMAIGLFILVVFALCAKSFAGALTVLFMTSGAALLIGALLGFLFGIPKSPKDVPGGAAGDRPYGENANLEEVSDWLTKIIIGLGLVELANILKFFENVGDAIEPALAMEKLGRLVGQGSILYFGVAGFLLAYVWTRVDFYNVLSGRKVQRLETKVAQLEAQEDNNTLTAVFAAIDSATMRKYSERDFTVLKPLLENVLKIYKANLFNRQAAFLLVRYAADVKYDKDKPEDQIKGLDEAIALLDQFIKLKEEAKQQDQDLCDAYFNRGAYRIRQRTVLEKITPKDEAKREALRQQALDDLKKSIAIKPDAINEAITDDDYKDLFNTDPDFKKLKPSGGG